MHSRAPGRRLVPVSDYLSDNDPENHRTPEDGTGPLTSANAVRTAGRTWSGSAWGSRGRRFKSCRPDGRTRPDDLENHQVSGPSFVRARSWS